MKFAVRMAKGPGLWTGAGEFAPFMACSFGC